MKEDEGGQNVRVDRTILQDGGAKQRLAGLLENDPRIGHVGEPIRAREINDHHAGEGHDQECRIDLPAPPQRVADDGRPSVELPHLPVGQRAGHARNEHEELGRVAEAVATEGQPAADIVGHVIEVDEPQRKAPARVETKVAVEILSEGMIFDLWQAVAGSRSPLNQFEKLLRTTAARDDIAQRRLAMNGLKMFEFKQPKGRPMTKPIPDKAEVALEYPDKFYSGTFERSSRFEAAFDANGVALVLERTGTPETKKSVHFHINYGLFADILQQLSSQAPAIPADEIHLDQLRQAAAALDRALKTAAKC